MDPTSGGFERSRMTPRSPTGVSSGGSSGNTPVFQRTRSNTLPVNRRLNEGAIEGVECPLRRFIDTIKENLRELERLKLSNTRREIKTSMDALTRLVIDFDKKVAREGLTLLKSSTSNERRVGKDAATQTERQSGTQEVLKALEEGVLVDRIPEIINKKWDSTWFSSVDEVDATDLDKGNRDRVIVYDLAKDKNSGFGRKMCASSLSLAELVNKGSLKAGHILRDEIRPKVLAGDEMKVAVRADYTLAIDSSAGTVKLIAELTKGLIKLVEYLGDDVIFCMDSGENKEVLKKLLEYYGRRYSRRFGIVKDTKVKKLTVEPGPETKKVAVKLEGRSYAEVIAEVKNRVSQKELGEVLSIRKGSSDEAIFRLKGNREVADSVVNTLTVKLQGAKVGMVGRPARKVALLIKDIEVDAKEVDVTKAIEKVTKEGVLGEPKLRPAFGETQSARVLVSGKAAKELLAKRRILVGYVSCRVFKLEQDDKCFRCREKGHLARNCTGPDRRGTCFKCGDVGHREADCTDVRLIEEVNEAMRNMSE